MASVLITCTDQLSDPVQSVLVRLFDNATSLVTFNSTDAVGEVLFDGIDPGDYTIRVSMSGGGWGVDSPQALTVVEGGESENDFGVTLTLVAGDVPSDPLLCRCTGYFRNLTGAASPGMSISLISIASPTLLGSDLVVGERVQITASSVGFLTVDLIRGARYRVEIATYDDLSLVFEVPDLPTANLPDVLFPVVTGVIFTPASVSVQVDVSVEVAVTVKYRSGLLKALADIKEAFPIEFTASDDSVSAHISNGKLVIQGDDIGSFTVKATRAVSDNAVIVAPSLASLTSTLPVGVTA
jgi:hypothetical protein